MYERPRFAVSRCLNSSIFVFHQWVEPVPPLCHRRDTSRLVSHPHTLRHPATSASCDRVTAPPWSTVRRSTVPRALASPLVVDRRTPRRAAPRRGFSPRRRPRARRDRIRSSTGRGGEKVETDLHLLFEPSRRTTQSGANQRAETKVVRACRPSTRIRLPGPLPGRERTSRHQSSPASIEAKRSSRSPWP